MTSGTAFVRNASVYLLSNLLNSAIPFLLLPFIVREIGAAEYGTLALFFSAVGIFGTLAGVGTVGYVRKRYHGTPEAEFRAILGGVVLILAAATSILVTGVWVLSSLDAIRVLVPPLYLQLALLAGAWQYVVTIRLAVWQMAGEPGRYGSLLVLLTSMNLLLSVALVFWLQLGSLGRILGVVVPTIALGFVVLVTMMRSGRIDLRGGVSHMREILLYSVPLVPNALAAAVVLFAERWAIGVNLGNSAAGIYFAGFQLAMPVAILATSLNLAFKSWSYERYAAGEVEQVVAMSYRMMLGMTVCAVVYAVGLSLTYELIVGAEMLEGRGASLILVAAALAQGFYLVVVKALLYQGRTGILASISVTLATLFCASVFLATSMEAVALLHLGYNVILFVVVWVVAARVFPHPWFTWAVRT